MSPIRLEFSEDPRDFQRREWSDLVRRDPDATFFHTPGYLKLFWEEFGEEPRHLLFAFAVDEAGAQVGVVAFELIGDVLRFLGGTEVTDYLGPVGAPETRTDVAAALWEALYTRDDWHEADLRGLPEDSAWLPALAKAATESGHPVEELEDQNGVAPLIELPATWDDYLAQIPAKLRHEIRRKAKKLEAEAGPFSVETATPETLTSLLDRFVELHRMSEGPKGVFMVPGMEIFFRRLGDTFCAPGIFQLTFIRVGDDLAAGTIGFRFQGTSSLYNSAFDRTWQHLSPGMVLVAENIRAAIDAGCTRFDLLKGDYAYKYRFGARKRHVRRLLVRRD